MGRFAKLPTCINNQNQKIKTRTLGDARQQAAKGSDNEWNKKQNKRNGSAKGSDNEWDREQTKGTKVQRGKERKKVMAGALRTAERIMDGPVCPYLVGKVRKVADLGNLPKPVGGLGFYTLAAQDHRTPKWKATRREIEGW